MKKQYLLFLTVIFSVNALFAQSTLKDKNIILRISHSEKIKNEVIFKIENKSNDDIGVDYFGTYYNGLCIEKPDGSKSSLGRISCGPLVTHDHVKIPSGKEKEWIVDIQNQFFYIPHITSPNEKGEYKIYWAVNGIISEPFFINFNK